MENILVCEIRSDKCYLSLCGNCRTRPNLRLLLDSLSQEQKNKTISFFEWKAVENAGFKQICKTSRDCKVSEMFDMLLLACDLYLKHIYIQRSHTQKFKDDKEIALKPDASVAFLQMDYAENFKCFEQNATQGGHYGYHSVHLTHFTLKLVFLFVFFFCRSHYLRLVTGIDIIKVSRLYRIIMIIPKRQSYQCWIACWKICLTQLNK